MPACWQQKHSFCLLLPLAPFFSFDLSTKSLIWCMSLSLAAVVTTAVIMPSASSCKDVSYSRSAACLLSLTRPLLYQRRTVLFL